MRVYSYLLVEPLERDLLRDNIFRGLVKNNVVIK